ncbi:MAG: hypothetical protein JXQ87_05595 [Bacteroidia bacterium]
MPKVRVVLLFFLIAFNWCSLFAQRFIPNEVSVLTFSGRYTISGLTVDNVFDVTPDFFWINDIYLPKEYFLMGNKGYETGRFINLGFRINTEENKRKTLLKVGFGGTSGFRMLAHYNYVYSVVVDSINRYGYTMLIDSLSEISAQSNFNSRTIYNIQLGLERELFAIKRITFRAGLLTQLSLYFNTQSDFYASSTFAYQVRPYKAQIRHSNNSQGRYSWFKEEENPFSFSLMLPLAFNYQLSNERFILKNTSLSFTTLIGRRFYTHPELPNFYADFYRMSFAINYSIN